MIGPVSGIRGFEFNRQALLESVGQAAREAVATYDRSAEARALAESVQIAVAETAIVEVGAIGLGALLVKLLAVTVADVTGLLAAGAVAALGLYVIPAKRRRAQKDLQEKIAALRARLSQALTEQFEAELGRSMTRIREAIQPYTRFIETQQTTLDESQRALRDAQGAMAALKAQIEAM